jgi:hypothetical protein
MYGVQVYLKFNSEGILHVKQSRNASAGPQNYGQQQPLAYFRRQIQHIDLDCKYKDSSDEERNVEKGQLPYVVKQRRYDELDGKHHLHSEGKNSTKGIMDMYA